MRYVPQFHHELGIQHLVTHNRAALFAGMGLGKTGMILSALERLFLNAETNGALIVAPLRVATLTWPDEVAKWDDFRWMRIADLRTADGLDRLKKRNSHLYILNYEQLKQFTGKYLYNRRGPLAFDTVIFDELTKLKNPDSKRANLFRHYIHKMPRRWGATGTPNPNSLLELYAQIRMLDDGERFGKSFAQFRDCYFTKPHEYAYNYEINDGAAELIHAKLADIALVLRSSDYLDVADTVLEDIEVPVPSETRERYEELQDELLTILDREGTTVVVPNAAVLAGKLRQMTGGAVYVQDEGEEDRRTVVLNDAKLKALRTLVKRLGEPVFVICNYQHERLRILKAFPTWRSFTGCKDERALLTAWNAGQIDGLVADPRSVGHGLNMQDGGRITIWYSLNDSRELYDQTNARVARTGQRGVPLLYRLISPGTVDEAVAETLRHRLEGQRALQQTLVNLQKLFGK